MARKLTIVLGALAMMMLMAPFPSSRDRRTTREQPAPNAVDETPLWCVLGRRASARSASRGRELWRCSFLPRQGLAQGTRGRRPNSVF